MTCLQTTGCEVEAVSVADADGAASVALKAFIADLESVTCSGLSKVVSNLLNEKLSLSHATVLRLRQLLYSHIGRSGHTVSEPVGDMLLLVTMGGVVYCAIMPVSRACATSHGWRESHLLPS